MEFLGFRKYNSDTFKKAKEFINYSNSYNLNDRIVESVIDIRRKHNIKLPDAIIAATAINNEFTLITRNVNNFKDVGQVSIFNPFN